MVPGNPGEKLPRFVHPADRQQHPGEVEPAHHPVGSVIRQGFHRT